MQNYENTKENLHKKWLSQGLSNDFIFFKVMSENPDACKRLLEILLNIEVEKIEIQNELKLKFDKDSKGVRLDLFVKNETHIFDIEVQVKDTKDLPERARYYQSTMDRSTLFVGSKYREMKTSHVIFLCLEDIFDAGLPVYSFENLCRQDKNLSLNDRAFKHFFIAKNYDKIKGNDELKALLQLMILNKASSSYTNDLKDLIEKAKYDPQTEETFMEWERQKTYLRDEGIQIGIKQGFSQGAQNARLETAKNLLKLNILTSAQISATTGLPLDEINLLKKEL